MSVAQGERIPGGFILITGIDGIRYGTSVENVSYTDRIDVLRSVPAHIRFVSFEPLLGPVAPVDLDGIHWAIVGGESGPGARVIDCEWVEAIQAACRDQRVAFFFKQWGGTRKGKAGRLLNGRTWDEYPDSPEVAASCIRHRGSGSS